jgi:hypothetical protein
MSMAKIDELKVKLATLGLPEVIGVPPNPMEPIRRRFQLEPSEALVAVALPPIDASTILNVASAIGI